MLWVIWIVLAFTLYNLDEVSIIFMLWQLAYSFLSLDQLPIFFPLHFQIIKYLRIPLLQIQSWMVTMSTFPVVSHFFYSSIKIGSNFTSTLSLFILLLHFHLLTHSLLPSSIFVKCHIGGKQGGNTASHFAVGV